MTAPVVKGWCPGALQPMMSGDGLVVRLRPFGGRLRRAQADGIAALAAVHGNGMLDLSSRGNLQIRGVTEDSYDPLITGLRALSLLDDTAEVESRRNILVTPFWQPEDETELLAAELADALAAQDAPALSHKFGFVVDTGRSPVLQTASGDIRLERDAGGNLILAAQGADLAKPVTVQSAVVEAMALARWFADRRGDATRMAQLLATHTPLPAGFVIPRPPQSYAPAPGPTPNGALVGIAFGQLRVETLASLAKHGSLRMTPWRMVLVENAREVPSIDDLITDPANPLLRVVACTGAPDCDQGHVATRTLARRLALLAPATGQLHVSGCAKGCAHPRAAALTVTGTRSGLSLIRSGRASDTPVASGLSSDDILKAI